MSFSNLTWLLVKEWGFGLGSCDIWFKIDDLVKFLFAYVRMVCQESKFLRFIMKLGFEFTVKTSSD